MKNLRIVAFSVLCVTINILLSTDAFNATAQGQSARPSLEGTRYEGLVTVLPPSLAGLRLLHTFYIFEKQGKVICRRTIVGAGHDQMEFKYNPVTRRNENVRVNVPSEYSSIDEIGTYQQTRTGVRLEFSDRYIEAAPKVERSVRGLDGITTYKESNKKEQFIVVLKEDQVSQVDNKPSNNAANSDNEGISLEDIISTEQATQPKRRTPGSGINVDDVDPNLISSADGTFRPASGYRWIDSSNPNDLRIKLMLGLIRTEDGHLLPAKGYRWVNPKDLKDFRVELIP
jgi:hypothetical protein